MKFTRKAITIPILSSLISSAEWPKKISGLRLVISLYLFSKTQLYMVHGIWLSLGQDHDMKRKLFKLL